ncbi:MAG: hypothetical protein RID23_02235 [Roseovarius sp.]
MNPDLLLVFGIALAVLSVPSMLSAFADRRTPRAAALVAIVAGCMIVWAIREQPGGYTIQEIPEVFVRVAAEFI